MSEENITENISETPNSETQTSAEPSKPAVDLSDPDIKNLVQSMVNDELSSIKGKLNDAYSARDEAIKAKALLEEEKKSAAMKQMEEEGRHKEVAELKMAELQAQLEAAQKRNTQLTRDHEVTSAVSGLEFRSELAAEMARDRILAQTVQGEDGMWRHKSGVSIKEFAEHFAKDDDNAFLFKPKTNSGAGTQQQAGTPDMKSNKPLTEMNTNELLAHFAQAVPEGHNGNW